MQFISLYANDLAKFSNEKEVYCFADEAEIVHQRKSESDVNEVLEDNPT